MVTSHRKSSGPPLLASQFFSYSVADRYKGKVQRPEGGTRTCGDSGPRARRSRSVRPCCGGPGAQNSTNRDRNRVANDG